MKKLALNNDYPITKINSQFGDIKISPQSNGDIWVWKGKELRLTLNNDEILPFINGLKK